MHYKGTGEPKLSGAFVESKQVPAAAEHPAATHCCPNQVRVLVILPVQASKQRHWAFMAEPGKSTPLLWQHNYAGGVEGANACRLPHNYNGIQVYN